MKVFAWVLLSISVTGYAGIFSMQRMGWPSVGFEGVMFFGGLLGFASLFSWIGASIIIVRLYRRAEEGLGALMLCAGAFFCVMVYAAVVDTLCQKGVLSVCVLVP